MAERKTKDQLVAEVDKKIAYHDECIAKLKVRKEVLLAPPVPKARKTSMKAAIDTVKGSELSPDEIISAIEKAKKAKAKAETK